ncbi:hypothetical protein LOTGIDRAFT_164856 [Lottia gigantea]|uniref:Uncharacterized protein n=1 Tax=Lottia gigantea TaxID=225164 RepID=V4BLW0_LOTGI|nr:hypothetical protein LOTGIDRAFT_164856 [Lottia gigantea]ESO89819.1 hypothetical protein LOTGIDRAFT_164856 [Lottia gigantea]
MASASNNCSTMLSASENCGNCLACMKRFSEHLKRVVFCVQRACEQIELLKERLRQIKVRYNRAKRDGQRALKHNLEMRYSIVKSALHIYQQYVERKETEFCVIKARIEIRMTAVLAGLGVHIPDSDSSSDDVSL